MATNYDVHSPLALANCSTGEPFPKILTYLLFIWRVVGSKINCQGVY